MQQYKYTWATAYETYRQYLEIFSAKQLCRIEPLALKFDK